MARRASAENLSPAMSAAAAARARLAPDEDSTMFFPGAPDERDATSAGRSGPGRDEFSPLGDFDGLSSGLDVPSGFEALDDLGGESGPALLAARAEPLGVDRRPPTSAKAGRSVRSGRPARGGPASRPGANRPQNRRKPKEPSKLLIGLGVLLVALAGVGAAYYLTQRGDDGSATNAEGANGDLAEAESEGTDTTAVSDGSAMEETAGPSTGLPPVVIFDLAAVGPVEAGVPYDIAVGDGPANAQYQLLVDGTAAAEPAAVLPPVTFEQGRHLLVIEITSSEGPISTDPVVVYAVGETPGVSYRANLSSVNIETEGWAEAVRQFDEFVAAGHDQLKLMPSSPFPSLVPGYWNLFVDGFDSATGATDYCARFSLTVPSQCFAQRFDPNAPAGG